jgi:ABC-type polysaccharide/polyol phosphate transport system ATPase subunit
MSKKIAVSVRNVSKRYLLYDRPQDRLKQTLFWRLGKNYAREFWALQDVSFGVRKGETIGIIGRNGSGKSTLLQIIAGTLQPTGGKVEVNGRVTALLELGSGFNPEFTGRENVYLNGAILGFSREQMDQRFDEIAAFADVGQFIDQPVKLYSSGMFVRLAFAVQVLTDPDVLIVDEALAVGDGAFQIKCMNRMRRLCDKGVTIILVTHDVQTVRSFCQTAIWLHDGSVKKMGSPLDITSQYVQYLFSDQSRDYAPVADSPASDLPFDTEGSYIERSLLSLDGRSDLVRWGSGELIVKAATLDNGGTMGEPVFEYGERLHVEFEVEALQDVPSTEIGFGVAFRNTKGLDVIGSTTYEEGHRFGPLQAGQILRIVFELDNILAPGGYALVLNAENRSGSGYHYYDFVENAVLFKVLSKKNIFSLVLPPVEQKVVSVSVRSKMNAGY